MKIEVTEHEARLLQVIRKLDEFDSVTICRQRKSDATVMYKCQFNSQILILKKIDEPFDEHMM